MIEDNLDFAFKDNVSVFRQIREKAKLSRKEFADLMNVHPDTIERWETGRQTPRLTMPQVKTLSRIASQLGINLGEIPDNLIN
jgi:DNA-binding transcriptional regulator YiaG